VEEEKKTYAARGLGVALPEFEGAGMLLQILPANSLKLLQTRA
jgi:hypothetical protein